MKRIKPRLAGRQSAVVIALAMAGVLAISGVALGSASSTFTFAFSPSTVPKLTYKPGALSTNLVTSYTDPGNDHPGGAVERTQIYLDKNFRVNPSATTKCAATQLAGQTMAGAMKACGKALVGKGIATANANGAFIVNGCVLLFNGKPNNNRPTINVLARMQASNPSTISCTDPAHNTQGNVTILLNGVLKDASSPYGKVLDVNHITQAAIFPLEIFKTKIQRGTYMSARCAAADKTWRMQVTWTYNNATKKTVKKTQPCKVG
jgi:hypothetical protein